MNIPGLMHDEQITELAHELTPEQLDRLCYCCADDNSTRIDGTKPGSSASDAFYGGISIVQDAIKAERDIYEIQAHNMEFWFIGTAEEILEKLKGALK